MKVECEGGAAASFVGTWMASATGVMAPSESFFEPLVAGDQKTSLAGLSPSLCRVRGLEGSLAWGPLCLVRQAHRGAPPWLGDRKSVV